MTKKTHHSVFYISTNKTPALLETKVRSLEGAQRKAQEYFGVDKKTVLYVTEIFDGCLTVHSKRYRKPWEFDLRQLAENKVVHYAD